MVRPSAKGLDQLLFFIFRTLSSIDTVIFIKRDVEISNLKIIVISLFTTRFLSVNMRLL